MDLDKAITNVINKYQVITGCANDNDIADDYIHNSLAWDSYGSEQQGLISATIVHTLCMMVYEEMKLEDHNNG